MEDRIRGGLIGMLVGDALGVPYEFHAAASIPPRESIEMSPPEGFRRSHAVVPVGTWSDDGAQALCLLASLLECERLDLNDLGDRLVRWRSDGYMAVDGNVFDIGLGTAQALHRIATGTPPREAGGTGERDNGNGSLMRVLPLVLWHRGSDAELARDAMLQSLPTHGHARSQVCCALYCVWARGVLEQRPEPWREAVELVEDLWGSEPELLLELREHVEPREPYPCQGTGYVVDCLRSAQALVQRPDYETVVRAAVALGNDTDTTACVAGGVAGLEFGVDGIPLRWRETLRGRDLLNPLLERLLSTR